MGKHLKTWARAQRETPGTAVAGLPRASWQLYERLCAEIAEFRTPFTGATNDPTADNLLDVHPDRLVRHIPIEEMARWFEVERFAVQKRLRPIVEAGLIERTVPRGYGATVTRIVMTWRADALLHHTRRAAIVHLDAVRPSWPAAVGDLMITDASTAAEVVDALIAHWRAEHPLVMRGHAAYGNRPADRVAEAIPAMLATWFGDPEGAPARCAVTAESPALPGGLTDAFWGETPAPVVPDTAARDRAIDALVTYWRGRDVYQNKIVGRRCYDILARAGWEPEAVIEAVVGGWLDSLEIARPSDVERLLVPGDLGPRLTAKARRAAKRKADRDFGEACADYGEAHLAEDHAALVAAEVAIEEAGARQDRLDATGGFQVRPERPVGTDARLMAIAAQVAGSPGLARADAARARFAEEWTFEIGDLAAFIGGAPDVAVALIERALDVVGEKNPDFVASTADDRRRVQDLAIRLWERDQAQPAA